MGWELGEIAGDKMGCLALNMGYWLITTELGSTLEIAW